MPIFTIGMKINGLANELNKVPLFSDGTVRAVQELQLSIATMKNAYRDNLHLTAEKLDQVSSEIFQRLEGNIALSIEQLKSGILVPVQQLTNTLPFTEKRPQLISISPTCVVIPSKTPSDTFLELKGNFLEAGQLHPILTFNGHQATLVSNSTNLLRFAFPSDRLFPSGQPSTVAIGNLRLSWTQGFVFTNRIEDVYRVSIGKLPPNPGKISLEYATSFVQREVQEKVSHVYEQHSGRHHANKDLDQDYTIPVTPGWKILSGSAKFVINWGATGGHHKPTYVVKRQDEDKIICNAVTKRHSPHPGKIKFQVTYTEYKDLATTNVAKEIFELMWKESRVFECPSQWKVRFEPFDQSPPREFIQPTTNDSFITLSAVNSKLRIEARDPSTVVLPAAVLPIPVDFASDEGVKRTWPRDLSCFVVGIGVGALSTKLLAKL